MRIANLITRRNIQVDVSRATYIGWSMDWKVPVIDAAGFSTLFQEVRSFFGKILVSAHWAILHGWAEPHYLASHSLMPSGTVLLYTPRDESELAVCRFHFSRAYEYVSSKPPLL
jgi:hypothetical protein